MTTTDRTNGSAVTLASMAYDALNRVITSTVVTNTATGLTGPALTTLTAYNLDGSVAQVQNPKGDVAYYTYNAADQLSGTEIDAGLLNPTTAASHATYEAYGYDAAGNVTSFADSDGRTTVAQYDGDNRVAQGVATSSGPAGTTVITTTPSYDPNGNTVSATTATQKGSTPVETHTVTDTYNTADWETATGDDGQTTSYGYDAAGQVRSETSGDGLTVAQANYDGEGRVTSISESAGGAGPYATQYTYNANDLPRTIAYPNGVQVTAGYDPNSALTSLALSGPNTGNGTTTLNTTYTYSYNAAGWTTSATTISGTDTITHDATGRLTDECGAQVVTPNGCYHWTYDPNGNVLSQITDKGTTEVYTYSQTQPNEVVQSYAPGYPDATTYYSYDSNGDITAITAPVAGSLTDPAAINTALFYDGEDRPITVTHLDKGIPITATLGYNAAGLRDRYTVVMSGTAITDERFTYRDGQIAQVKAVTATLNSDGSVKSTGAYTDTYIYGASGEPLEFLRQQNGATNRYWYVLDGQGSVVAVTDSSGAVVDRYNYDSWGEPIGTDYETVPQQVRYAGYWWDGELVWYWLTSRYYDPEDLHYLQPDPSDLDGVHTYAYVGNDPIDYADPSGLNGNGIVNNVAQEIIDKMIQRLLSVWPEPKGPGEWAPPRNQPIELYIGFEVHRAIANYYIENNPEDVVYTNNSPLSTILEEGFKIPNPPLTQKQLGLKPDILNYTRRWIYEIKPYRSYGAAVSQLKGYLAALGKAGGAAAEVQPGPANAPGVSGIVSAPGGYAAFVSPAPGAILYRKFNGRYKVRSVNSADAAEAAKWAATGAAGAALLWKWITEGLPLPSPIPVPASGQA